MTLAELTDKVQSLGDRVDAVSREFNYANRCRVFRGKLWGETYPPHERLYARIVPQRNNRVMSLARAVRPAERVLDVGCGFGDLLFGLRDDFAELYGADPSAEMAAHTTENLLARGVTTPFTIVRALAEDLPFRDAFFDAVVTTDTYEHIHPEQRGKALAEFRRVLRPGGRLVLVTPSFWTIHAWAVIDNLLTLPRQVRAGRGVLLFGTTPKAYTEEFCTARTLRRDVRRAGFEPERFERLCFYPAPERQGFLQPFLPSLFRAPRLYRAIETVFEGAEALRIFNQKMLVACRRPGPGE
ncbi:MAG TPA: class I SAM-dependent methyltransferase [Phycisphaerales bacterium]|nr:class I SAM-dependent methyltransferase [Phycisphaerales bacterium]